MLRQQRSVSPFAMALVLSLLLCGAGAQAEITLSHAQVTDVTPSGFSVVWHASESSMPSIGVYTDAEGTQEISDQVEVIAFPVQGAGSGASSAYEQAQSRLDLQQTAQQKGLNKIQVRGLSPQTDYYLKVFADSATDNGSWPGSGTQSVTTQQENSFLQDGAVVVVDVHDPDAKGWIVAVSVPGSSHPVSSVVGAGGEPGQAVVNLANLFGSDGRNWYSTTTTMLTLEVIKGDGTSSSELVTIDLSPSFAVASQHSFEIGSVFDALIQIVSPAQKVYSQGENITLAWSDEADSVNATISLYIDVDSSGEDGVLIASGIEEDPDGADDQYDWDVSGVTEGSYYVYAQMSDGSNSVTSYGSAKITIDHNKIDGDADDLSDLWELHYFDTLARDGSGDLDGDGVPDSLEQFYAVNPEQINAPLQSLTLALEQGAQIIGVPGLLVPRVSSYDLLTQLGTAIESISRYNRTSQERETSYWDAGSPAGDEFSLLPGEGYFMQMLEAADVVWTPFNSNRGIALKRGVNVIALTDPSGNAFGLLDQLGSDVIWSIRRLNQQTALYETAAFDEQDKVGVPFAMQYGEGYIVTVK